MLSITDKIKILTSRLDDLERSTRYLREPLQEELEARKELGTQAMVLNFIDQQGKKAEALAIILEDLEANLN
jgi:hypothetical protein